jgi:hypothetical protein
LGFAVVLRANPKCVSVYKHFFSLGNVELSEIRILEALENNPGHYSRLFSSIFPDNLLPLHANLAIPSLLHGQRQIQHLHQLG